MNTLVGTVMAATVVNALGALVSVGRWPVAARAFLVLCVLGSGFVLLSFVYGWQVPQPFTQA